MLLQTFLKPAKSWLSKTNRMKHVLILASFYLYIYYVSYYINDVK